MKSVGSYEAKTHLPQLLTRVAKGERITITKHGVPIAILIPAMEPVADIEETIEEIRRFRRGKSLGGKSIREMIDQGRRR